MIDRAVELRQMRRPRIEVPEWEFRHGMDLCNLDISEEGGEDEEGEEWKRS